MSRVSWPATLQLIADELGDAEALRLAAAYGGRVLFVPLSLPPGHALERELGRDLAMAVVRLLGPGHVEIPLGPLAHGRQRGIALARAVAEGGSANQIAARTGYHIRSVHRAARACAARPRATSPACSTERRGGQRPPGDARPQSYNPPADSPRAASRRVRGGFAPGIALPSFRLWKSLDGRADAGFFGS